MVGGELARRINCTVTVKPFGHREAALKELRETALKGKSFKMHRMGADGKRVVEVVNG
jgi:hypothetical protein